MTSHSLSTCKINRDTPANAGVAEMMMIIMWLLLICFCDADDDDISKQ